uniref:Uncharacterized protein n=1 Tax=Roseihalotalea indica TaxID=2867963 RepID=A0AA49GQF2_9BACT|nr:hypothetical protein K4G66_23625 [Tunicatimonas sp. TK19036]
MRNINVVVFTILVTLFSLRVEAQSYRDTTNVWRSGFYFSIPVQTLNLTDLNRQLREAGQPEILTAMTGISMGFTNRHRDQNSYGLTQFSLLSTFDDENDPSRDTRLVVGKFSFSGQYDILSNPKWLAYPYLRLGFSMARLRVSTIDTTTTFMSSVRFLGSPDYVQKKYTSGVLLNGELGAGIERQFSFPGTTGFIGISAGYELSTGADWQIADINYLLANSPNFRTNGLVVELRIRLEYNPLTAPEDDKKPKGLYRFFQ